MGIYMANFNTAFHKIFHSRVEWKKPDGHLTTKLLNRFSFMGLHATKLFWFTNEETINASGPSRELSRQTIAPRRYFR